MVAEFSCSSLTRPATVKCIMYDPTAAMGMRLSLVLSLSSHPHHPPFANTTWLFSRDKDRRFLLDMSLKASLPAPCSSLALYHWLSCPSQPLVFCFDHLHCNESLVFSRFFDLYVGYLSYLLTLPHLHLTSSIQNALFSLSLHQPPFSSLNCVETIVKSLQQVNNSRQLTKTLFDRQSGCRNQHSGTQNTPRPQ
jgi:hypothetical protein